MLCLLARIVYDSEDPDSQKHCKEFQVFTVECLIECLGKAPSAFDMMCKEAFRKLHDEHAFHQEPF